MNISRSDYLYLEVENGELVNDLLGLRNMLCLGAGKQ